MGALLHCAKKLRVRGARAGYLLAQVALLLSCPGFPVPLDGALLRVDPHRSRRVVAVVLDAGRVVGLALLNLLQSCLLASSEHGVESQVELLEEVLDLAAADDRLLAEDVDHHSFEAARRAEPERELVGAHAAGCTLCCFERHAAQEARIAD